jgi:hypothetical protein
VVVIVRPAPTRGSTLHFSAHISPPCANWWAPQHTALTPLRRWKISHVDLVAQGGMWMATVGSGIASRAGLPTLLPSLRCNSSHLLQAMAHHVDSSPLKSCRFGTGIPNYNRLWFEICHWFSLHLQRCVAPLPPCMRQRLPSHTWPCIAPFYMAPPPYPICRWGL